MTACRWTFVLTMVESICAVDFATVSKVDGRGVEEFVEVGRRSGRYISSVSTYKYKLTRLKG